MKLTYWIAKCLDDNYIYSIRATTRKAVMAELVEQGLTLRKAGTFGYTETYYGGDGEYDGKFSVPQKVVVEYTCAFDLLDQCLGEDHIP